MSPGEVQAAARTFHRDGARQLFTAGQIVRDALDDVLLVVVQDNGGPGVIVSSMDSLKPDATLLQRAQWQLPASDLETTGE